MIRFQYNKTSLNELGKQYRLRKSILPSIKSKEAALRAEVSRARVRIKQVKAEMEALQEKWSYMEHLWAEFDAEGVEIDRVVLSEQKVAGVLIPQLEEVVFREKKTSLHMQPLWFWEGVDMVKQWLSLGVEREVLLVRMQQMERARKKTTQKVNLYEKVQMPGYEEAMRKIKRFLEDKETVNKAAQKLVKKRKP
ncbi:MAG: V-type ATP synthase subunit D [Bacteroidota bacterium]